jgi:hypothetical protein
MHKNHLKCQRMGTVHLAYTSTTFNVCLYRVCLSYKAYVRYAQNFWTCLKKFSASPYATVCDRACLKRIQLMPNVPLAYVSVYQRMSDIFHTLAYASSYDTQYRVSKKKTLRKFDRLLCIINVGKQFDFYIGRKSCYLAFLWYLFEIVTMRNSYTLVK